MRKQILLFLGVIVIVFTTLYYYFSFKETQFKNWCKDRHYTYVYYDVHSTIIGTPYYYLNKNQHIYEFKFKDTNNKLHTYWVRTGWWNDTIKE